MTATTTGVRVLVDCDVCAGSGLMAAHMPTPNGEPLERDVVWCPRCHGRGVLWGTR